MHLRQAQTRAPSTCIARGKSLSILLAGRFDQHLIALLRILDDSNCDLYWFPTLADAVKKLSACTIHVVICDRDLPDGTWTDMLARLSSVVSPPQLIVADQFPTERLCADVWNLGGFDVLAKPYDGEEVMTAITWASERWARSSSG